MRYEDFEGQDLKYLLEHFGSNTDYEKVKVFIAGRIMIKQDYDGLKKEFQVKNMYERCKQIKFKPNFKEITFKEGSIIYNLVKFSKNKRYHDYPVMV